MFVKNGVPQGSIFGPFLFIIYTDCIQLLLEEHKCDFVLYVDDTTLIIQGKQINEIEAKATIIISEIYNFFASLKLALNLDKTICVCLLNSSNGKIYVYFNGVKLQQAGKTNFLGMVFNNHFIWSDHIKSAISLMFANA